jgi:lycopene cyclase domain-containing protein
MVLTVLGPVALSFDKNVHFVAKWKWAILAALVVAIPYLVWDEIFTRSEFWGFNEKYLLGFNIGSLPIEEVSFFLVVPFACIFIYECVLHYFRDKQLKWFNSVFWIVLFVFILSLMLIRSNGRYTIVAISCSLITIFYVLISKSSYRYIPLTFLFSLIPFVIVNGILTGSFLSEPIVWYNETEFSGLRIFTIPAEDVIYSFGLITLNIIVYKKMMLKFSKST